MRKIIWLLLFTAAVTPAFGQNADTYTTENFRYQFPTDWGVVEFSAEYIPGPAALTPDVNVTFANSVPSTVVVSVAGQADILSFLADGPLTVSAAGDTPPESLGGYLAGFMQVADLMAGSMGGMDGMPEAAFERTGDDILWTYQGFTTDMLVLAAERDGAAIFLTASMPAGELDGWREDILMIWESIEVLNPTA